MCLKLTENFSAKHSSFYIFLLRFLTVATAIADSAQESVSGQRSGAKVEPGTGLIHSLIGEKSVTERWLVNNLALSNNCLAKNV